MGNMTDISKTIVEQTELKPKSVKAVFGALVEIANAEVKKTEKFAIPHRDIEAEAQACDEGRQADDVREGSEGCSEAREEDCEGFPREGPQGLHLRTLRGTQGMRVGCRPSFMVA